MTRPEDVWQCTSCTMYQGRHDMWFEHDLCEICHEKSVQHYKKFMLDVAARKVTFFLFGDPAVELLVSEEKTPEYIVNELQGDYAVFSYTEGYNEPSDLLAEYNGWNDFTEITPDQYYEFLINETK